MQSFIETAEYGSPATEQQNIVSTWTELGLVLFVAFAPFVFSSVAFILLGNIGQGSSSGYGSYRFLSNSIHEVSALLVLCYVLSRSGRTIRSLGVEVSSKNLLQGVALITASLATYFFAALVFQVAHHLSVGTYAHFPKNSALFPEAAAIPLVLFSLLNPFFEEVIVRGYLMTEITTLSGSTKWAILASVAVQTSYHLYQGWIRALSLAAVFLLLSIYYARTRRLLPVIIAHLALDSWFVVHLLVHR